jgi:hypothetical protein
VSPLFAGMHACMAGEGAVSKTTGEGRKGEEIAVPC